MIAAAASIRSPSITEIAFQIIAPGTLSAASVHGTRFGWEKNWSGRRDSNPRPQPWQGEIATSGYLDLLRNNALLCEGVRDLAAVSNRTGVKCNASGGKGVKAGTGNREVTAQAGFYRPCRFPTA